jgi:hypothetical protein
MLDKFKQGLTSQAGGLVSQAGGLANQMAGQVDEVLRQVNEALPLMETLGLSVDDMSIKMGMPPEFNASIIGSVEALDEQRLGELATSVGDNKLAASLVEALRTAAIFKEKLKKTSFKGVKLDVKLGLLPSIHVGLLND